MDVCDDVGVLDFQENEFPFHEFLDLRVSAFPDGVLGKIDDRPRVFHLVEGVDPLQVVFVHLDERGSVREAGVWAAIPLERGPRIRSRATAKVFEDLLVRIPLGSFFGDVISVAAIVREILEGAVGNVAHPDFLAVIEEWRPV